MVLNCLERLLVGNIAIAVSRHDRNVARTIRLGTSGADCFGLDLRGGTSRINSNRRLKEYTRAGSSFFM